MILVQITKAIRDDDLHVEFDNQLDALLFIAQNAFGPDGYRMFQWEPGGAVALRENSKAVLRIYNEVEDTEVVYKVLEDALSAISFISPSDGYELIDLEQPLGSAPSIIIEARPTLWQRSATPIASRENEHARADQDRF